MSETVPLNPAQWSWLEKLHLHFNLPEQAIICTRCRYALAVDDDRVGRHLGEKHNVAKGARRKLNSLINSLQLPGPDKLPKRPDGSAPSPHLQSQLGAACKHCGLHSTSLAVLSQHVRQFHRRELAARQRTGKQWLRDHIIDNLALQSWTMKDIKRSWIVLSEPAPARQRQSSRLLQPAPDSIQLFAEQLFSEERKHLGIQSSTQLPAGDTRPTPQALLVNWIRRTAWDQTFRHAHRNTLIHLSILPLSSPPTLWLGTYNGQRLSSSAADERKLCSIVLALDRLFDRCGETVRFTDVSVRRWLRGRFPDRPYKAPFELVTQSSSERLYRNEFKRCICFWLRLRQLPTSIARAITGRPLSRLQRAMLNELWLDPSNQ